VRFKRVPDPPRDIGRLDRARRAVPLVPDPEADCCARLRERLDLPDRDAARAWLTFLRALELVERTDRGYRRVRPAPGDGAVREAFEERVYGAREALDAVAADGPLTASEAFDRLRDRVPAWERARSPDWAASWRERTRRLLDWAALLGLVERRDGTYAAVE
jgi:hypothetical protein